MTLASQFTLVDNQQVLKTSAADNGTLLTYYNFAAAHPSVTTKLKTGDELSVVSENAPMASANAGEVSEAYIALKKLGGDPFTLQAQLRKGAKL